MQDFTHHFDIRQESEREGTVRVVVLGDLDLATADVLADRLGRLGEEGHAVHLDVSELSFIDARGLKALIYGVAAAEDRGWELHVDRRVSRSVARLLELTGAESRVWPSHVADGEKTDAADPDATQRPSARRAPMASRRSRRSGGRQRGRRPPVRPAS